MTHTIPNDFLAREEIKGNGGETTSPQRRSIVWTFVVVSLLFSVYRGTAITENRALFADGAVFFMMVTNNNGVGKPWQTMEDPKHIRLWAQAIIQAPLIAGLKLGIKDIPSLRLLYGIGVVMLPMLGWIWAVIIFHKGGLGLLAGVPILNYFLWCIISDIYMVTPATMTVGLIWVLAAYGIVGRKPRWIDWTIGIIVSMVLYRSYEITLIVCPMVALILGIQAYRLPHVRMFLGFLSVLMLGCAGYTYYWQYTHVVGTPTDMYVHTLKTIITSPSRWFKAPLYFSVITCIMMAGILIFPKKKLYWLYIGSILMIGRMLQGAITMEHHLFFEFQCRVLIGIGTTICLGGCMVLYLKKDRVMKEVSTTSYIIITGLIVAICQTSWQITNTLRWRQTTHIIQQAIHTSTTPLVHPSTVFPLGQDNMMEGFGGSYPALSIALSKTNIITTMMVPVGLGQQEKILVQPFSPPIIPWISLKNTDVFQYKIKASYP
jgi:hypothetical protein